MSRSAIYTANTTSQTLAVDNNINFGSIVRRYGCNVDLSGSSIMVKGEGYYDLDMTVTAAPVAAGTVTITAYKNNVPIPGATSSAATTTAGNPVNLSINCLIRENCAICDGPSNITLVLSGSQSVVSNVAAVVEKL